MERPNCKECGNPMTKHGKAGSGNQRWECKDHGRTTDPTKPRVKVKIVKVPKIEFPAKEFRQTLILTWAQNATPTHKGFMTGIHRLRRDIDATLMIQAGSYENPTSVWSDRQEHSQWWWEDLRPFLVNQRTDLNRNLVLMADVNARPTDQYPLSGMEGFTHGECSVLGHPKRELVMVPTPQQRIPKLMVTTGACTIKNYTESKAGKKGEFHHIIGAVVIELVDGKIFHHHNISARPDGAFCYFEKAYYPDGSVGPAGPSKILDTGDLHPRWADPGVIEGTFGRNGLADRLDAQNVVLHDALDFYAGTRHHENRPFIALAKQLSGFNDVEKEVQFTIDFIIKKMNGRKTYIVPSNHDDMFRQWIERTDWKKDPVNMRFYLRTASWMADNTVMTKQGAFTPDPFIHYVEQRQQRNIVCLKDKPLTIAGYLLSLHGDKGANGARPSIKSLAKIGTKSITGHGHSHGVEGGHSRNGTCTFLSLEYTGPIGSWTNSHTSVDSMKKEHAHFCIDGRFWK